MRILLDTNIIISRESNNRTDFSIALLYKWIDRLHYEKCIHPATKNELNKHKDDRYKQMMLIKLSSYNELVPDEDYDITFKEVIKRFSKRDSDHIDNSILFQVYIGRADLLITEDKLLHIKAEQLGISNKVLKINNFVTICQDNNPDLVEYKSLPIFKTKFGYVDINDFFFESFKRDYPKFEEWFHGKNDKDVYITKINDKLVGFLYLKTEDSLSDYSDVVPPFEEKKRLKVGTFKIETTGLRLGERYLKIILDNARLRNVEEVYVTLFETSDKLKALKDFLLKWGFKDHGYKITGGKKETVLVKKLDYYDPELNPRMNYPLIKENAKKFILPIEPTYHTDLFPEAQLKTEKPNNNLEAHRFAVQKVYVFSASTNGAKPGDLVLIYRKGESYPKKYSSVVTTIAIVHEIVYAKNIEEYKMHCENRSVFTGKLDELFKTYKKIVKLLELKTLKKKVISNTLINRGLYQYYEGPRTFFEISDNDFKWILEQGETKL